MGDQVAAPFVAKTYQMVSDRRTDLLIKWGKANNSFVVLNPSDFSQFLLPCYFKHSNFSSFVRQLNTYGFRKVDPDRWEFAHPSFLRGQTHLLPHVTRRSRKGHDGVHASGSAREEKEKEGDEGEAEQETLLLLHEVCRLRQEQRVLDEELLAMSKRLQDTERRPQRIISFLIKLVGDPRLLSRLLDFKEQCSASTAKRKRLVAPPSIPSLPPCPTPFKDGVCSPSILMPGTGAKHNFALVPDVSEPSSSTCNSGSEIGFPDEFGLSRASRETAAAFPFSLLGHGFY